jgi:pimeloyl-ACP methyl ester carboxylesterase
VTFILDIDHSDTKFGLQDESAKRTIQLPIGFDPAEDRIYPLIVKLDILPGAGHFLQETRGDDIAKIFLRRTA